MNYGVVLTGVGSMADPETLRRAARKADQLGFRSLWIFEHTAFPTAIPESYGKIPFSPEMSFLEPVTTLAYLAAETTRIRLGTGILLLALRHPLQVAKAISTLDVFSGGRAMLGVGLGWLAEEYQALGVPFGQRVGRVRESVEVLRKIWTSGKLRHEGRYYPFSEVTSYPLPVQTGGPPIWFGGFAKPALKRAVELGDGWLGTGGRLDKVCRKVSMVRQQAQESGKEGFQIAVGASPEVSREEVDQLRQAGADQINLSFLSGEASEIENLMEAAARRFFS